METETQPIRPVIRIERGYAGIYLYKLQNPKFFGDNWRFRYWVITPDYIFEHLNMPTYQI